MISTAEGKKNRRELERSIVRERKKTDHKKLVALRAQIRDVKRRRKRALCKVRGACRRGRILARQNVKARVKAIRVDARAQIKRARIDEKQRARATCKARKETVRRAALSTTAKRREVLQAERSLQAELRRIERSIRDRVVSHRQTSAKEARQESDDAVRHNVPPELVGLFEQVKRSIHGNTRASRTEVFLQYAEEHPDEILASYDDLADREVAKLVAQEAALSRAVADPRRYSLPPAPF